MHGTCCPGCHGYHSQTCLFFSQRSVVQATPQTKAGPVQQLTVQGLQPVHVAQEVRVPSLCVGTVRLVLGCGWGYRHQIPREEWSHLGARKGGDNGSPRDVKACASQAFRGPWAADFILNPHPVT